MYNEMLLNQIIKEKEAMLNDHAEANRIIREAKKNGLILENNESFFNIVKRYIKDKVQKMNINYFIPKDVVSSNSSHK